MLWRVLTAGVGTPSASALEHLVSTWKVPTSTTSSQATDSTTLALHPSIRSMTSMERCSFSHATAECCAYPPCRKP